MSNYQATIDWRRGGAAFTDLRYSRAHRWLFDGGIEVAASSSPQVVPVPMSLAAAVDTEEAFVASLASCHMLWFLSIAAARGFCVDSYHDHALGHMSKDAAGKTAITLVTLRPAAKFSEGKLPDAALLQQMHVEAHHSCFIANSVKTEIRCEPIFD